MEENINIFKFISKFITDYRVDKHTIFNSINHLSIYPEYKKSQLLDRMIEFAITSKDLELWQIIQQTTNHPISAHIISNLVLTNDIEICRYGFTLFNMENLYECTWHKVIKIQNLKILEYLLHITPPHIIANHLNIYTIERILHTHNLHMLQLVLQLVYCHMENKISQINPIIHNDLSLMFILSSSNNQSIEKFINKLSSSNKIFISQYREIFRYLCNNISLDIMYNIFIKFL